MVVPPGTVLNPFKVSDISNLGEEMTSSTSDVIAFKQSYSEGSFTYYRIDYQTQLFDTHNPCLFFPSNLPPSLEKVSNRNLQRSSSVRVECCLTLT